MTQDDGSQFQQALDRYWMAAGVAIFFGLFAIAALLLGVRTTNGALMLALGCFFLAHLFRIFAMAIVYRNATNTPEGNEAVRQHNDRYHRRVVIGLNLSFAVAFMAHMVLRGRYSFIAPIAIFGALYGAVSSPKVLGKFAMGQNTLAARVKSAAVTVFLATLTAYHTELFVLWQILAADLGILTCVWLNLSRKQDRFKWATWSPTRLVGLILIGYAVVCALAA